MPKGTLAIKRQLRSIANTKKITKAMELVSASKMRRAVNAVIATRPYTQAVNEILEKAGTRQIVEDNIFFSQRQVVRKAVIVISSNRGLCGGFNSNIIQKAVSLTKEVDIETEIITLGKKGRDGLSRYGYHSAYDYEKKDVTREARDVIAVIKKVVDGYESGHYDRVEVVYTHFFSAMSQRASVLQLLPLGRVDGVDDDQGVGVESIFEPTKQDVLMKLIPRLLEARVFQAVLESEASEHSARMMAMRNAHSSASDMFFDLQLAYNQARQASITQEIAEISSGAAAMQ